MTRVWAHRGANRVAPENTPEAFAAAAELGADGVELDVWVHRGELVVVHDVPTGGHPTLAQCLAACGDMTVNVEIKGGAGVVERVIEAVQGVDVVLSSFDLAVVDRVKELDPAIPTAYLLALGDPLAGVALCRDHGHPGLHPWHGHIDASLMAAAEGLAVRAWTVNDPARAIVLADLGVEAIVTDAPDLLLRTRHER